MNKYYASVLFHSIHFTVCNYNHHNDYIVTSGPVLNKYKGCWGMEGKGR